MADLQKELFGEAIELRPDQRRAFLETACGGDATLLRNVEKLLAAHDQAGDFLAHPAALAAAAAAAEANATEDGLEPEQQVGNHRLIERIGSGGFGSVWRARQLAPVVRDVALKVVRADGDGDGARVAAAFATELGALARMQHPGIAQVFDAGRTDDGRPWLSMELVDGEPIASWCRRNGADLRTRLTLLVAVCAAVQHAHGKGIVHRDLKPSNVLVTTRDGAPRPIVIDFGVARAFDDASPGDELPFGTPEYMSPEQIAGGPHAVDTRSDVWSLGVMLYELAVGARPHQRTETGQADLLRRIREADAVPASAAANERLPREIDWITQQAMARDPAARYPTVAALGDDIGRLLDGHAVLAGPDSAAYRWRRFVRRHALAVVAAAAVLLSLGIGASIAVGGWIEARAAEQTARHQQLQAEREAERAQRVVTVLDQLWSGIDPARLGGEHYPVRELLADFERTLATQLEHEPAVELHLRRTLAQLHRFVGAYDAAEAHATRVTELAERLGDAEALQASLLQRARLHFARGNLDGALADTAQVAALATPGSEPFAAALEVEASCRARQEDVTAAIELAQRALRTREALGQPLPIAHSRMQLANLHGQVGRIDVAMLHVHAALAAFEPLGLDHPDAIVAVQHLGFLQQRSGDFDAAEISLRDSLARRRRVYGERHAHVAWAEADLAWLLHERQHDAEAAPLLRNALPVLQNRLGEHHLYVTETMQRLGAVAAALGEHEEAERMLGQAIERSRVLPGHPVDALIAAQGNLSKLHWARGEHAAAIALQETAVAQARQSLPEDHYLRSIGMTNLAYMLSETSDADRAIELLREALRGSGQAGRNGENDVQRRRLVELLRRQGREHEAEQLLGEGR